MFIKTHLFFITVAAFAADSSLFETRKEKVRTLLSSGDFLTAAEQAKVLNRETPDDVSTYQLLASAELALGNYDKAEASIQWMLDLRIGKADSAGWLLIAQLREATGDLDGAIDAINLAYSRIVPGQQPDAQSLLLRSAKLQIWAGKLALAEKILQSSPAQGEEALATLAKLRMAQHRDAEALTILRKLTHPKHLFQLAQASGKIEDYQAFEKAALLLKDNTNNANRELILYYSNAGKKPAQALELATKAANLQHDVLTLDALAVAQFAAGNVPQAHATMKRVLAVGAGNPEILQHAKLLGVSEALLVSTQ